MKQIVRNATVWQWKTLPTDEAVDYDGESNNGKTVVIENGIITRICDANESLEENGYDVVIDAKDHLILPGLQDAHIHVAMMAQSRYYIDFRNCFSIDQLVDTIRESLLNNPVFEDLPFIVGVNWDQSQIGRLPSRQDLDHLPTTKPMFLWRACWHIGIANTAALKLANLISDSDELIDPSLINTPGGGIDVLPGTCKPTGILRENSVTGVVNAFNAYQTHAQKLRFLREGLQICLSQGLTTVHTNDEFYSEAYHELQSKDELPIRVLLTPSHNSEVKLLAPHPLISTNTHNSNDLVSARLAQERVKIFSDGSLGAETAALTLPAGDGNQAKSYKGILMQTHSELVEMLRIANERHFRVEIHAIGDAAADHVITALEVIQQELSPGEVMTSDSIVLQRPILTHCQVLSDEIIQRMKKLNIIANVQPSFVPTDMRWVNDRLRADQMHTAYAWKTLMQRGVVVAGGSDAPIEDPNPFTGMHDAIFRSNYHRQQQQQQKDQQEEVFRPEEKLNFAEALGIYTYAAAYAAGYEKQFGVIGVGYIADMVIVDRSILDDHRKLLDLQPDMVIVGGEIAFMNTSEAIDQVEVIKGKEYLPENYSNRMVTSIRAEQLPEKTSGLPGKNGPMYAFSYPRQSEDGLICQEITSKNRKKSKRVESMQLNQLRCACMLVGKYCKGI